MPRRRGNNEGTIVPVAGGKKYRAWVTIGYDMDTGRPVRKSKTLPTKKECVLWIQQIKSEYGPAASKKLIKNPSTLLADYFKDWFKYYIAPTVKESTHYNYHIIYDKHIKPALGKTQIKDVTTQVIQKLYAGKLSEGLSGRTVHLIHYVLSAGLKQAVAEGIIADNPAAAVKLPTRVTAERPHLDAQQAKKLLQTVAAHRFYPAYLLALTCGMRRGEILGLTWADVDLNNKVISIKNSLTRVSKTDVEEGELRTSLTIGKPKTKYSQRVIPISEHVCQHLMSIQNQREQSKLPSDFVLCTSNGTPYSPDNLLRFHRHVAAKLGFNITFHDLRHTFATLAGGPPIWGNPYIIKSILGHSNRDITAHYMHTTDSAMRDLIEKVTHYIIEASLAPQDLEPQDLEPQDPGH